MAKQIQVHMPGEIIWVMSEGSIGGWRIIEGGELIEMEPEEAEEELSKIPDVKPDRPTPPPNRPVPPMLPENRPEIPDRPGQGRGR